MRHDFRVEADPGHQQKAPRLALARAENLAGMDAARGREGGDVREPLDIAGQVQLIGEHIGRAEGQERQRQPRSCEPVHGLIDRAVATGHGDRVEACRIGAARQSKRMERRFRLGECHRSAKRVERAAPARELRQAAFARHRIVDDQESARARRGRGIVHASPIGAPLYLKRAPRAIAA